MSSPQLVTYYNNGSLPLSNAANLPYTTVNLAFLFTEEAAPLTLQLGGAIAASSTTLTQATKDAIAEMHKAGQKVLISFGGATMTTATYKAIYGHESELAKNIARFISDNKLDGIDIDWEDTSAFMGSAGYDGVALLVNLTRALREVLPPGQLITHAPQPPYMQQGSGMSGYIDVMTRAGNDIDWLNMQFYNNSPWSSNPSEIVSSYQTFSRLPGMTPEKLLVGLPVTPRDAGSGYIPVSDIVTDVIHKIQSEGPLGGMMNWQFSSDVDGDWAKSIWSALT
ncbi:glycosyl hydrolase family 18 protein [Pseudomonadota bacterium]